MSELRIYVEGSSYEIFTYANSTADETISFATLLNRADSGGNKPVDTINSLINDGYEYTTNNTSGYYFRFWNGSESLFNSVWQNVTLKANAWWDAEVYMGPSAITVTLSFDTNGGSPASYQSVSRTDYPSAGGYIDVQIPSNYSPTKTNYDFGGWLIGGNTFQPGAWVGLDSDTTATAKWVRAVITVSLSGTTTSDSITVNAPTGVPNDSTFFVWQLYQGATLKVDDSTNTLDAYKFENLDKGTSYTVKFGAYTASGGEQTAKGEQSFTTTSSNTWIYTSSGWKLATPYIYTSSGWKEAQSYIYTSSGWKQC